MTKCRILLAPTLVVGLVLSCGIALADPEASQPPNQSGQSEKTASSQQASGQTSPAEGAFTKETISTGDESQIGKEAPGFSLPDSFGKSHSLAEFKGKIVVLEWINFTCPFVGKHYTTGNMQKLQKGYRDKGVVWLSLCSSAPGKPGNMSVDQINKTLKEKSAAPAFYLIDEQGAVGRRYGAKATPTMCVIDKDGVLVYKGAIDDKPGTDLDEVPIAKNYVRLALDEMLAGKPVTYKGSKPYGCSIKY